MAQARDLRDEASEKLSRLDAACAELPEREQVQWALSKLQDLEQSLQTLDMEAQLVSEEISWPKAPGFAGEAAPEELVATAKTDGDHYQELTKKKYFGLVFGILLVILGGVAAYWYLLPGIVGAGIGAVIFLAALVGNAKRKRQAEELSKHYGSSTPELWLAAAKTYESAMHHAREQEARQLAAQEELSFRRGALEEKIAHMTQGKGLQTCRQEWDAALRTWDDLADASRDLHRAEHQLRTLQSMARTADAPAHPDELTYTELETERLLSDSYSERRQIESRLSQYTGRVESMGDPAQLKKQLEEVQKKLRKLEDTYAALTIAQDTLTRATQELQRRFAPRISKRACELMNRMTGGRYDRLQLGEDFSLLSGAEQENVLHDALWRSDGTADQLYLALRLAVAEELAVDVPLILDDALVRFDDDRMKAAVGILKEEARRKQVILFSCQSRENNL